MRSKRPLILWLTAFTVVFGFLTTIPLFAASKEKVLHSFNNNGTDGYEPYASLIFDAAGNLYGTTAYGGSHRGYHCGVGCGTVFELTPSANGTWAETVLYSFQGSPNDGYSPTGGLIFDASGNLYGTTLAGGDPECQPPYGCGTVFELTPGANGTWTEKVLHNFSDNGTDGWGPSAGLIFDTAGNLYGTTYGGGAYGPGTVFELTPSANGTWTETVLHSFGNSTDGGNPFAILIFDTAGNLYGTTKFGGTYDRGTVFQLTPSAGTWTETVLHVFKPNDEAGINPVSSLIFDASGNLYGTTSQGSHNAGAVFELSHKADGRWAEKVLHNFNFKRGSAPFASLIFDASGNLYGTTLKGGTHDLGTVFELTSKAGGGWTEKILHNFKSRDGSDPQASLTFDAAGNLYGTTPHDGAYHGGTVFEIAP